MTYNFFIIGASLICLIAVVCSGCIGPNPEKSTTPTQLPSSSSTIAEKSVVDANNRFALNLYSNLRKDPHNSDKTLFFSPFSISSALAVAYEGARGSTADEIQSVFLFPIDNSQRRMGFEQLNKEINLKNSRYTLVTANALWAEKTHAFLPEFITPARVYYNANVTNLDFINQPEKSRITINTWIEDQTNNKIKDLVPSGAIDQLTRLVITNAVYFKGKWVEPFDENQTKDDIFYVSPGSTVPVHMMQRTDEKAIFWYTETENLQVLEMPYAADNKKQISMIILLPKNMDLTSVENSFTIEQLTELKNALRNQRVNVTFPKFKLETKYDLPETLIDMGMESAFTNKADFSGMDGTRSLFIGDVIHQAYIDVNEEGTEAAAATGVVEKAMALPHEIHVPTFRADHPFVFIIQDKDNGNILFMGRVNNPDS